MFAENLSKLTFVDARGNETNLARHLVLSALERNAFEECHNLHHSFGVHCVGVDDRIAERGWDFAKQVSDLSNVDPSWRGD